MALLTENLRARLEDNGRRQHAVKGTDNEIDFAPVVKLFTPLADSVWLLTEIDPADVDKAFGLHDPGNGHPELGYVSLADLEGRFAQRSVRRDDYFRTDQPLSVYVKKAGLDGRR